MLLPSKVKHRKWRKGIIRSAIENRGTELAFGSFGLKAMEAEWISARQIEAARRTVIRYLKKGGKFWIRIFPDKPVTKKGTEVPMGGGKGGVDHYVFPVRPGRIIFEMAGDKLPIKTKFIKR